MFSRDITLWKIGPFIFQNNVDFSEHVQSSIFTVTWNRHQVFLHPSLLLLHSTQGCWSQSQLSRGQLIGGPRGDRTPAVRTHLTLTDELPVSLMCMSLDCGKKHEPTQTHGEHEDSTQRGLRPRNHTCNPC